VAVVLALAVAGGAAVVVLEEEAGEAIYLEEVANSSLETRRR